MLSPEDEFLQRYQAGAAALDRGDWERARREFERLTLDLPEFAPAWDGLGRALDGLGDLTRAGRCFRRSSRLDRGSWQSRYHWGTALYRAGDLLQSRRWLRAATRLGPAERANHHRLGLCLADLGDLTGALRSFHRALECPENGIADARLWVCIGDGERDRGEYDQADAAFQRACLLAPSDPVVYHHWALLARRREAWDEAEQLARRARALERDGFRALVLLVELALERSDWSAAEVRIGELEQNPAWLRLAEAFRAVTALRRGSPEEACTRAISALRTVGAHQDGAADRALEVLRVLRGEVRSCRGYRLLVEVREGEEAFYCPYVVLAGDEPEARAFVAELQDLLEPSPWEIVEVTRFRHRGEAHVGVYQVTLPRVRFRIQLD